MTMTDTEAKALALELLNTVRDSRGLPAVTINEVDGVTWFAALCRAIEREAATEARHAAELREQAERFSEVAVKVNAAIVADNRLYAQSLLAPFILPAPDPLVEEEDPIDALVDLLAPVLTHSQGMAARERENRFRNALAALKARGV